MKRKTFIQGMFGIAIILLANGLSSKDIIIIKITMVIVPLILIFTMGYQISLIPIDHRRYDIDAEFTLNDFIEVK